MNKENTTDKYAELKRDYEWLPLNKYQSDIYSQNGEDGVVAEILKRLDLLNSDGWCVEFGAWDGKYLSNTFFLVERHGYHAVYIEGDRSRFNDLLETVKNFSSIIPVNAFVARGRGQGNSLDDILSASPAPQDITILSIDIDSYDLDVWESLAQYSPIVVVIEINSSVLPGIIWRHSNKTPGNTFSATCNVGREKGYTLVCHTGNLIFVRNDHVPKLKLDERFIKYPELLFLYNSPWLKSGAPSLSLTAPKKPLGKTLIPRPLRPYLQKIFGTR